MSGRYERLDRFFERMPGRCGGRPTFIGRRVEPWYIAAEVITGTPAKEVAVDYDLTVVQVLAAVRFITAHPEWARGYKIGDG